MQIGEVAARAGVSVDAVRYYERQQLIAPAPRSTGGFRLFPPDTVERLRFIKQAQGIGLSLDEIRELLATSSAAQCQHVHDLLRAKLAALDERVSALRAFRRTLATHLAACEAELAAHGADASCPVMVNILRDERKGK